MSARRLAALLPLVLFLAACAQEEDAPWLKHQQQSSIPAPPPAKPKPVKPAAAKPGTPSAPVIVDEGGRYHIVQGGESLGGIAKTEGVSVKAMAELNHLALPYYIHSGQRLLIPDKTAAEAPPSPPAAPQANGSAPPTTSIPVAPPLDNPSTQPAAPAEQPAPVPGPATPPADSAAATPAPGADTPAPPARGGEKFAWPVRGEIISRFGPGASEGLRNDGINIAVPAGTPVRAADNGTVAYAGNELKGFGNLILLQHAGGWTTAYAHNQELLVKKGQTVKRGQIIAKAGSTGVDRPQVHFEVRKEADPVDPLNYLGPK